MATIRKRDNSWQLDYSKNGKRYRRNFKDYEVAVKALKAIRSATSSYRARKNLELLIDTI